MRDKQFTCVGGGEAVGREILWGLLEIVGCDVGCLVGCRDGE